MANDDLESGGAPIEEEPFQVLFRRAENGKNCVDKRPSILKIINFKGKELSITMENDDLESGGAPNEEKPFQFLLQRAKSGKNCADRRPSICMVPSVLRKLSKKSFIPRVVSIGPLHKDNKNLQEFERLKNSYLNDLLSRSSSRRTPEDQLNECLEKVKGLMKDIKSSYDYGMIKKYKDTDLASMMVLDASFILEFCLKQDNKEEEEDTYLSKIQITWIAIDLMLLENQIPFIVLQAIFNCTIKQSHRRKISLTCLLRRILRSYIHLFCNSLDILVTDDSVDSEHAHVLDCLHKIYKFKPSKKVGNGQPSLNYNHSVVELDRSGVDFKPHEQKAMAMSMKIIKSRSCFNLSPWSKRTLFMPTLVIQEFTETVLRNFIAYEQFSPEVNYYFTSYASAMDMLIDSEADVDKLVGSKVIVNNLGSNGEVARVINGICVNIEIERFFYSEVIQELDKYYNSYWPKQFAYVKRTYFNSPWSMIAFFAGFIVFGISIFQAVMRIRDM